MSQNLVEVLSVTKSFKNLKILRNVSFAISKGSIFGVLGPNGSGKTTLIRILFDLVKPDEGEISFERNRYKISYLPEERGLHQEFKVLQVITYFGQIKGLDRKIAKERGREWLSRFDLSAWENQKIGALSKGMQQKVQIIISLIQDPDLVVLDEPFSGLDYLSSEKLIDLILDLKKQGKTVVLSTHQMSHAEILCDHLVLLHKGEVLLSGSKLSIMEQIGGYMITVRDTAPDSLITFPGVRKISRNNGRITVYLGKQVSPRDFLNLAYERGLNLEVIHITPISLDELFIRAIVELRGTEH
jgi:ABC-2 type transport system ATP-binding protein